MKQKDYDILRELRRLSGGEDNEFEIAVAVGRTFDENCNFSDLDGAIGKLTLPRESKASRSLGIYIDFLRHIGFKSHSLERVDLLIVVWPGPWRKKGVCRLLLPSYLLS